MYTCEDYIAGKILKLDDEVQFNDRLKGHVRKGTSGRYYISMDGPNDAPFTALGMSESEKYILCKNWSEDSDDDGIFPYHNTLEGLTKTVANLWVRFGILDACKLHETKSAKEEAPKIARPCGWIEKGERFSIGGFVYTCGYIGSSGYFFKIEDAPSEEYMYNDGIFRYLGIAKNDFFQKNCEKYGGSKNILDAEICYASPYAKTLEGFNNVVDNLRKIYALPEYKKERVVTKEELEAAEVPLPWDDDRVYKDIKWHNPHTEIKIPVSKPINNFKIVL